MSVNPGDSLPGTSANSSYGGAYDSVAGSMHYSVGRSTVATAGSIQQQSEGIPGSSATQQEGGVTGGDGQGAEAEVGNGEESAEYRARRKAFDQETTKWCIIIGVGLTVFVAILICILNVTNVISIFGTGSDDKGASTMEHTSPDHSYPEYNGTKSDASPSPNLATKPDENQTGNRSTILHKKPSSSSSKHKGDPVKSNGNSSKKHGDDRHKKGSSNHKGDHKKHSSNSKDDHKKHSSNGKGDHKKHSSNHDKRQYNGKARDIPESMISSSPKDDDGWQPRGSSYLML
ncbi:hypothetical protein BDA99DRAFT_491701 [Phascolomyces articulosus]|uniref:Uncharacterized protein n=1 Tax=Phascolomyces articulosus TaxID=60185 RepID=A0AAD5KBJ6_9FUNG|nr:hypothetical protein BDA99DRAFT_491701 [Phascolomyces articulosus]